MNFWNEPKPSMPDDKLDAAVAALAEMGGNYKDSRAFCKDLQKKVAKVYSAPSFKKILASLQNSGVKVDFLD